MLLAELVSRLSGHPELYGSVQIPHLFKFFTLVERYHKYLALFSTHRDTASLPEALPPNFVDLFTLVIGLPPDMICSLWSLLGAACVPGSVAGGLAAMDAELSRTVRAHTLGK